MKILFNIAGLLLLMFMYINHNHDYFYLEKSNMLRQWLSSYASHNYSEKRSQERLSEDMGISLQTLRNYFYGNTKIDLTFLLYVIFTFRMDRIDAYAFLSFFGFSKQCIDFRPYHRFHDLIGDYKSLGKSKPKEYVDSIIKKSK